MTYNQTKTAAGQVMPLLMGCTIPSPIQIETEVHNVIYDPMTQKAVMDMRVVGTKSLKQTTTSTGKMGTIKHTDKKNEIDDSKSV